MATLLAEKVYQHLRKGLLAGEFPPGSRLEYKSLSTQTGVSTTPVREAMGMLASEGLVDLIPHTGAVVRVLEKEEAVQLYGIREAIETYAAARAAERISDASLQHLDALLVKMRQLTLTVPHGGNMRGKRLWEFLESDLAFHMTIIEAAENPRLTKLAGDSHVHLRILGIERFEHDKKLLDEADEIHTAIYLALKKREPVKARELVASHIKRSFELTLNRGRHNGHEAQWQPRPIVTLAA